MDWLGGTRMLLFGRVVIIGVGLIGGSLGMAIKKDHLAQEVIGVDVNVENLKLAKELQAVDGFSLEYDVVKEADLVVLAAPITVNCDVIAKIAQLLKPDAIVTDVSSTKGSFVTECESFLEGTAHFVGGHPMAGSEQGGVKGADAYLFENAIYILTPTKITNQDALDRMEKLVTTIGSKCLLINPDEHDLLVAAVSHLPHLVASALVNTVAELETKYPLTLSLAAGGFRDTTRIASGNPQLWQEICFANRDQLLHMLRSFQEEVDQFIQSLEDEKQGQFKAELALAKDVRDRIPAKLKGYWPFLEEVLVNIPDQPGTIGQVAAILGAQDVNIDDIEILHVREGEGGSLRLGFAKQGSAKKAIKVLNNHGFLARTKLGS